MDTFEVKETKEALIKAVSQMAEREKTVLTLYYYEGLTLAEIGDILGVTECRVCQIHTKAVLQLRAKLADRPEAGRPAADSQGRLAGRSGSTAAKRVPASGRRLTAPLRTGLRVERPGRGHYHGCAPPTGGAYMRDLARTRPRPRSPWSTGCCGRE